MREINFNYRNSVDSRRLIKSGGYNKVQKRGNNTRASKMSRRVNEKSRTWKRSEALRSSAGPCSKFNNEQNWAFRINSGLIKSKILLQRRPEVATECSAVVRTIIIKHRRFVEYSLRARCEFQSTKTMRERDRELTKDWNISFYSCLILFFRILRVYVRIRDGIGRKFTWERACVRRSILMIAVIATGRGGN